jgi:hypothetical protein
MRRVTNRNQPRHAVLLINVLYSLALITPSGKKATRDRLNETLKLKLNTQQLVIASITKTAYSQNIVLVATQHFSAQDLMNNTDVI